MTKENVNFYWVGARQSDVESDTLISGSITRFGNDNGFNYSFCNNNFTEDYISFVISCMNNIIKKHPNSFFIFANEQNAYLLPEELFSRCVCLNNLSTLTAVNNKIFLRNYLGQYINTPISMVLNGDCAKDYSFVVKLFNNKYDTFVIQSANGGGGVGTYLINQNTLLHQEFPEYVLISPYIKNALSLNVHFAISNNSYRIFQPSIQIILESFKYSGSDYIQYQLMSESIKRRIVTFSNIVARSLQQLGARGLMGIDIIIQDNNILFLECNMRYQGSTRLLNMALHNSGYPSVFQVHYDCFYKDISYLPETIYNMPVNYSSFRRCQNTQDIKLENPLSVSDFNTSKFASADGFLQYEIYNYSIISHIEKQLRQNPC